MTNKSRIVFGTAGALVIGLVTGTYLLSGLNRTSLAEEQSFRTFGRNRPEGIERPCSSEDFQAIKQAIENNDYNAWKELSAKYADQKPGKGALWGELIDSQEKFEKFSQIKQLMDQGKFEEARQIRQELGFPMGPKFRNNR